MEVQSNDGVAITDTARGLDFVLPRRSYKGDVGGCVAIPMIMFGLFGVIAYIFGSDATYGWLWLLLFLGGLVIGIRAKRAMDRTLSNREQSAAQSRAVWQNGWFCHRCGGAFFPVDTPHTVPTGRLLSPAEFQEVVRDAGRVTG